MPNPPKPKTKKPHPLDDSPGPSYAEALAACERHEGVMSIALRAKAEHPHQPSKAKKPAK